MGEVVAPPARSAATVTAGPLPSGRDRPGVPAGLPDEASVLGRAGQENFTVASRLVPRPARRHLMAFYGYARLVDQIGDAYIGDRPAALDWVDAQLDAALVDPADDWLHPLVSRAAASIRALGTDPAPLRDLISANRQDQVVTHYRDFEELLSYCRLSANPVGRLVLAAFAAATPPRLAWSDDVCSGLQLVEHCQDIAEDRLAGRVYLPQDDMGRFGVTDADLLASRGAASPALRGLVGFEAARARRLLKAGTPLVASLSGRARLAVAGFVAGGRAALDALAAGGYDPLGRAPSQRRWRVVGHTARALSDAVGR